jgi:hypothetical protein
MTAELQADDEQSLEHVHTPRCYWDFTRCSWVCRPAVAPVEQPREEAPCT